MPTIAHFFFGAMLGIILYFLSERRFSKHHVFIFCLNNYFGPDLGWALGIGQQLHTVVGWLIFSIILVAPNSYFTRFTPDFKRLELVDLGQNQITFVRTYAVVAAGGILHNYLDAIINYGGVFFITPAIEGRMEAVTYSLHALIDIWRESQLGITTPFAVIIGILFIIGFIYILAYVLQAHERRAALFLFLYIIPFVACFYMFGDNLTQNHADIGALIYISLYWLLPLSLCLFSAKNPRNGMISFNPGVKKGVYQAIDRFMPSIFATMGMLFIFGGLVAIIGQKNLTKYIEDKFTLWVSYLSAFGVWFIVVGIILLIFGGSFLFAARHYFRRRFESEGRLLIVVAWLWITGLIGLVVFATTIYLSKPLVIFIFGEYGQEIEGLFTISEVLLLIHVAGYLLAFFGIFNVTFGWGLLIKTPILRKSAIIYHALLAWTIIGLIIACFLCENEIKAKFVNKTNQINN
jgi:hypothetical protein